MPRVGLHRVALQGMDLKQVWLSEEVGSYTIGRLERPPKPGLELQIILDSAYISKKHCTVLMRNGLWYITDHDSLNGTFLNGAKLTKEIERELREGDNIGLGVEDLNPLRAPPLNAYFVFVFSSLDRSRISGLPICFPPPVSVPVVPFKKEKVEVITISDDEDEIPRPSSAAMVSVSETAPLISQNAANETIPQKIKAAKTAIEIRIPSSAAAPLSSVSETTPLITQNAANETIPLPQKIKATKTEIEIPMPSSAATSSVNETTPLITQDTVNETIPQKIKAKKTAIEIPVPSSTVMSSASETTPLITQNAVSETILQKIKATKTAIEIPPVVYLSKSGGIHLNMRGQEKRKLHESNLIKIENQFKHSCSSNGVAVRSGDSLQKIIFGDNISSKRKRPSHDDDFRVPAMPKRFKPQQGADDPKLPKFNTTKPKPTPSSSPFNSRPAPVHPSASTAKKITQNEQSPVGRKIAVASSKFKPMKPSSSSSFDDTRPSVPSNKKETQRKDSVVHSKAGGSSKSNVTSAISSSLFYPQPSSKKGTPQKDSEVDPELAAAISAKIPAPPPSLNTVVKNVHKKFENSNQKGILMVDAQTMKPPRGHGLRPPISTPLPQRQGQVKQPFKAPAVASAPTVQEKLKNLSSANAANNAKKEEKPHRTPVIPPVKSTAKSRNDLFLQSLTSAQQPKAHSSSTTQSGPDEHDEQIDDMLQNLFTPSNQQPQVPPAADQNPTPIFTTRPKQQNLPQPAKATAVARVTPRQATEGVISSIATTNPVQRIKDKMDNIFNLSQVLENPLNRQQTPPLPVQNIQSTSLQVPEAMQMQIQQQHETQRRQVLPNNNPGFSGAEATDRGDSKMKQQLKNPVVQRMPDDLIYRDMLNWNPHWLDEQGSSAKPPPVCGSLPILTNLPIYKDYESYKNTFYPLMLLELWASIMNDYKGKDKESSASRHRLAGFRCAGSVEFPVAIERLEKTKTCPLLPNFQPTRSRNDRRKELESAQANRQHLYVKLSVVTWAERRNEINHNLDFGIITLDVKRSNGQFESRSFFAFFQQPLEEEFTSHSIVPVNFLKEQRGRRILVRLTATVFLKYDYADKFVVERGTIKKICYISPKTREFKSFAQLPDSTLFQHILSPPECALNEICDPKRVVHPSEIVNTAYNMLNPTQRAIVYHISQRIFSGPGPALMLLHGPPGTGKTRTIVGLILQLTKLRTITNKTKILVCTPSNTALDEILLRLVQEDKDLKILRHGPGNTKETMKFTIEELAKRYLSRATQVDGLNETINKLTKSIEYKKQQVEKLKLENSKSKTAISSLEADIRYEEADRERYSQDLVLLQRDKKGMEDAKFMAIRESQVVFSTLNSCSSGLLRRYFTSMTRGSQAARLPQPGASSASELFTCCIIDEATQTTEPESLQPLMLGCEKLVLVGDPKQLPATVLSVEAENRKFRQSLFARLYNHYEDPENKETNPIMMLTTQYRMHKEILKWPNEWFYGKKLNTQNCVNLRPQLRIKPYLFLNVSSKESNAQNGQISNNDEVKFLKNILTVLKRWYTIDARHRSLAIGIITPYVEQKKKVFDILESDFRKGSEAFRKSIEVDTVDSFQGREKDIILISCVRTQELGFVKTAERLNVALTRAKQSLIILGNAECLNSDSMWKNLMDDASTRDCYKSLPLDILKKPESNLLQYIENILSV